MDVLGSVKAIDGASGIEFKFMLSVLCSFLVNALSEDLIFF